MKKTLIALMALAGIASATTPAVLNEELQAALASYEAGSSFEISFTMGQGYSANANAKMALTLAEGYYFLLEPGQNGYYSGLSSALLSMSSPTADDCGNMTGAQTGSGAVDGTLTIQKEGNAYGWMSYTVSGTNYTRPASSFVGAVITFAYDAENSSATFTLDRTSLNLGTVVVSMSDVSFDAKEFSFGGALGDNTSNLKVTYAPIPEPTTATLSLLALAGLAARRRRK